MFQRYLLSSVYRSPDDPAAEPADPAVVAADPQPDPPAADPAPARPQPAMVPLKVMLERVGEETSKRQAVERRAAELEEITRRLQAQIKPDPAAPPARTESPVASDPDAVRREAAQLVFADNAQKVSDAGLAAYGPKWADAVNTLNAVGANSAEFVASVMELDLAKAHDILFTIAQDPEKAASLAKMTSTRRIIEIVKMANTPQVDPKLADPKPADPKPDPKPAAVSRAPAPKPVLVPQAAAPEVDPRTPEGNEKMDDKGFEDWYKKTYYKRSA